MSLVALRERHIDRLLSEELEASPAFAAWFSRTVFGARVPEAEPTSCSTTIGHHRVAGETDILVKLGWGSGTSAIIHVEDKLGALPQPDQALRYAMAVRQAETISPAASALVAPQAWIRRHPRETSLYDVFISLEEIASHIRARVTL